jgi:hypothetical protein
LLIVADGVSVEGFPVPEAGIVDELMVTRIAPGCGETPANPPGRSPAVAPVMNARGRAGRGRIHPSTLAGDPAPRLALQTLDERDGRIVARMTSTGLPRRSSCPSPPRRSQPRLPLANGESPLPSSPPMSRTLMVGFPKVAPWCHP